jgi:hypothetical protein
MDVLISQEELLKLAKDYVEKKGHTVSSVNLYINLKEDSPSSLRRFTRGNFQQGIFNPSDLIDQIDLHIICKIDS